MRPRRARFAVVFWLRATFALADDMDATVLDATATVVDDASVEMSTSEDAAVVVDAAPIAVDPRWRSVRAVRDGDIVHSAPNISSPRRGTLAAGSRLPVLEAQMGNGCHSPWARVATEAWVCTDHARFSADEPAAVEQPVVSAGQAVPFRYGTTTHDRTRVWRSVDEVGDGARATWLGRATTLAFRGTRVVRGYGYGETADHRWVALADIVWSTIPRHRPTGRLYPPQAMVGLFAFAPRGARAWPDASGAINGSGATTGGREILRHEVVRVRDEHVVRGIRVVRTERGWVHSQYLVRPDVGAMPTHLEPTERWVDVDRSRQIMVAYEGPTPVWAALVSTGRTGHATTAGEFRVRVKLSSDDMSNTSASTEDRSADLYFVARVPWVMYYHRGEAFHAAFWHDDFGQVRSHGCINLSPEDARWLFRWAPPLMPAGWTSVFPSEHDLGMRVRVRLSYRVEDKLCLLHG
jgi:hypothetical protein